MAARRRNELGATALLTAILGMLMLGIGALAVDLGQAYAKKSLAQTDVDLAVLAAAQELDSDGACNAEVIATATEYLEKPANRVSGQPVDVDLAGSADDADGYISCANWRVDLWAPQALVDYGLAPVLGVDSTTVNAHAAAQIKAAARAASLPFFAAQGCDSGHQVIRDDSGPSGSPVVAAPSSLAPSSSATINASFTIDPNLVPAGTTAATITISGTQLKDVDAVGFTGAAGPPYHFEVSIPPHPNNAGPITVAVPAGVLAVEDSWWVRLKEVSKWSKTSGAQRLDVGSPRLFCDSSYQGNFGTIDLPRTDTNSFPLQWNIAEGVEPTLAVHPAPNGQCDGQAGSVISSSGPVDGTNCVYTEPGLKIAQTNEGLVIGKGGVAGRLNTDSVHGCGRNGTNDRTSATISGYRINDDVLTCFITNGASIQALVDGGVTARAALSSDIYDSPRFFWIPVLVTDPSTGRKAWPIVRFRPGFITDQSLSATHDAPGTISDLNGLVAGPSGIREVHVVLFDEIALPEIAPAQGGEADYTGSGPKVIVLVD
jgi:Putative Flp pilus-assembly TadE/G-like